jgi:hypothetical protein
MEKAIDPKKTFYQIGDLFYPQNVVDNAVNAVMQANMQHLVDRNAANPRRAIRKIIALQTPKTRKAVWKKALEEVQTRCVGISLKHLGPDCTIIRQQDRAKELA